MLRHRQLLEPEVLATGSDDEDVRRRRDADSEETSEEEEELDEEVELKNCFEAERLIFISLKHFFLIAFKPIKDLQSRHD